MRVAATHRDTHPTPQDGCNLCRWLSVAVAPSATPTRNGGAVAAQTNAREDRWQKDMPAYKAMRRQGLQPRQIDGCDELSAKATDRLEVELGHVLPTKEQRESAKEGMAIAQTQASEMKSS